MSYKFLDRDQSSLNINSFIFKAHMRKLNFRSLSFFLCKPKNINFYFIIKNIELKFGSFDQRLNDCRCLKCMDAQNLDSQERVYLHYLVLVPKDSICMKIDCWIKPEAMPLFSTPFITCKHVCLQGIRPSFVAQEFKVNLIMFPSQVYKCL